VGVVPFRELHDAAPSEPSARIRERVLHARARQAERTARTGGLPIWNSSLGQREIQRWCRPTPDGSLLLEDASDRLSPSSRGVHRVLKVASHHCRPRGSGRRGGAPPGRGSSIPTRGGVRCARGSMLNCPLLTPSGFPPACAVDRPFTLAT
jgi:hypothetical protein